MTEAVVHDQPLANTAVFRPPAKAVSASALALHLDCSHTYIGKLEAEGVIQRHGDGFLLDQSRVTYLRYLRRERRQSPRAERTVRSTSKVTIPHEPSGRSRQDPSLVRCIAADAGSLILI